MTQQSESAATTAGTATTTAGTATTASAPTTTARITGARRAADLLRTATGFRPAPSPAPAATCSGPR